MKIKFHKNFEKRYKALNKNQKKRIQKRLELFSDDQFHEILNNHSLKGKFSDYRSINVGGDLRAIYKLTINNECIFVEIGTHNQLYF